MKEVFSVIHTNIDETKKYTKPEKAKKNMNILLTINCVLELTNFK